MGLRVGSDVPWLKIQSGHTRAHRLPTNVNLGKCGQLCHRLLLSRTNVACMQRAGGRDIIRTADDRAAIRKNGQSVAINN
jgi:hypothetical protein